MGAYEWQGTRNGDSQNALRCRCLPLLQPLAHSHSNSRAPAMSAEQGVEEEDQWPLVVDSGSEGEKESGAAAGGGDAAVAPRSGVGAGLSTESVGAWLKEWASGPDSALLAGGAYRVVRQQVLAIAKRVAAVAEREKKNQQRRRFREEMERQRSATELLPPNEITTGPLQSRAIMAAESSGAIIAVAAGSGGGSASATTISGGSGSTAVSVSGGSGGGGALWRREPRAPKAPKPHLRPDAAIDPSRMNRHQLQDVTRTVRQLRHLSAHRCYGRSGRRG